MKYFSKLQKERASKANKILIILTIPFWILFFGLIYHQIIKYDYYSKISVKNQMRKVRLKGIRGEIYDRNGVLLVTNISSYNLNIIPYNLAGKKNKEKRKRVFEFILSLKNREGEVYISKKELYKLWKKRYYVSPLDQYPIIENIDFYTISKVEEHSKDLPGVVISPELKRYYIYKDTLAHITGYVASIHEEYLKKYKGKYKLGDKIGYIGLEKEYEDFLRGKDGFYFIEVNALGKKIRILKGQPNKEPQKGYNLYTTIDYRLQKIAYKAIPDTLRGSFIAINPTNGEILALVSKPSYDPNIFNLPKKFRTKKWVKLIKNPNKPLNNRAISGLYPPGSTFKIVTALSGLEYNLLNDNTTVICRGKYKFGNRYYKCWKKTGHGKLNLYHAIEQSCNVFFYPLGVKLGIEKIKNIADMFGFDEKTGIDLPGEKSGYIITPELYNKMYRKKGWIWTQGMLLNTSIGQGALSTPIQLAVFASALANGKFVYEPFIVKKVMNDSGYVIWQKTPTIKKSIEIKHKYIKKVKEGMYLVVNGDKGTAKKAKLPFPYIVYGKTGSSQTIPGKPTTALFIGWVEKDSVPLIAFSCVIEEAGHGGSVAAPIVNKILKEYFKIK